MLIGNLYSVDESGALYSPDDVAKRLGLHVRTVRRYIREGRLRATRIGKQYRIAAADLEALVGAEASPAATAGRTRRVLVSTIVDVDAVSRTDYDRIATPVTAAPKSGAGESSQRRVDCIYYEEQARLRITITADPGFTSSMLALIDAVLEQEPAR